MSRIVPNSYQKPNLYTDRLMRFLTGDEWKTLDYALRRTFGWSRERDRISVSQFSEGNGRLGDDGRPVEFGTGLSRAAQIEAINELMRFGILIEVAPNNAAKQGRLWELQLDESRIRFGLIQERYEARQTRNRQKTAAARRAAIPAQAEEPVLDHAGDNGIGLSHRPMETQQHRSVGQTDHRSVGQTGIGLWDRPVSVCGTDPQKHSKKPSGNPGETHSKREGGAGGGETANVTEGMVVAWGELVALCDGDEAAATQVWRLQERFAAVTKLKRPDPATTEGRTRLRTIWWPNLKLILADAENDPAAAEAAMQEAVGRMDNREQPLNVVSPQSIVKVAQGVLARQRRGGDGGPRAAAAASRPKGFAGIDAYVERRGGNIRGN